MAPLSLSQHPILASRDGETSTMMTVTGGAEDGRRESSSTSSDSSPPSARRMPVVLVGRHERRRRQRPTTTTNPKRQLVILLMGAIALHHHHAASSSSSSSRSMVLGPPAAGAFVPVQHRQHRQPTAGLALRRKRPSRSLSMLQQQQQQQQQQRSLFVLQQPAQRRLSSSSSSSSLLQVGRLSSSTHPADDGDGDGGDNGSTTTKNSSNADAVASKLQRDAARMRLEAEKMDWELTNQKLQALQGKVDKLRRKQQRTNQAAKTTTTADNGVITEALHDLERQMDPLRQKLENKDDEDSNNSSGGRSSSGRTAKKSSTSATTAASRPSFKSEISRNSEQESSTNNVVSSSESLGASSTSSEAAEPEVAASTTTMVLEKENAALVSPASSVEPERDDWVVFDDHDLELYLPVAREIEARLASHNATADEKLQAFRTAPELQSHFQQKIAQLIVEPMQDVQRLEELQSQYLRSTSVREKEQLKRQIDKLSQTLEDEYGRFQYSDSVYRPVPPLNEARLQERLATLKQLPPVLQTLYLKRYQLPTSSNSTSASDSSTDTDTDTQFRLALLLDHYEQQMQLLDQVKLLGPANNAKLRAEVEEAVAALPPEVRRHLAGKLRVPDEKRDDKDALVRALTRGEKEKEGKMVFSNLSPLSQVVMEAMEVPDDPSYNDIAFVDRSRYVEEFYPGIARMESQHPSPEVAETFAQSYIDRRSFMVTSKPERVIGGWYIRGRNLMSNGEGNDDDGGVKLMEQLQERVNDTSLQYFYIPDPSPLTDEEVELEYRNDPVIVLTANDPRKFYNYADPWVKAGVSAVGVASIVLFALGVCALEPALQDRLNAQIDQANAGEIVDLSWLTNIASDVILALGSIQLAHELGHRWIAWRDRFEIGLPTPVPSAQLGCFGTITPLKSPPPNLKSMFDFGVSGPLFGMVASVAFLVQGLTITANLDLNQVSTLPVLPSELLSTSALGGGLIETFLGRGALIQGASQGFLPLHPFAIGGFLGILTNALALLPLGNTDGGRIALAMFGRRGAYIVKTFTTALLCLAGIVGFDKAGVLLTYVLFVVIWQRELEAPARNEVEELDFVRGASGIGMAIFVALALFPIQ